MVYQQCTGKQQIDVKEQLTLLWLACQACQAVEPPGSCEPTQAFSDSPAPHTTAHTQLAASSHVYAVHAK